MNHKNNVFCAKNVNPANCKALDKGALSPLGKRRIGQDLPVELEGWRVGARRPVRALRARAPPPAPPACGQVGVFPLEPSVSQEFTLRNVMAKA